MTLLRARLARSLVLSLAPSLALSLSLLVTAGCHRPAAHRGGATELPVATAPPVLPPADLLALVHLGHPRATAEALGTATGRAVPVDLSLALGLGVDVSVLGAVDTARPVDVALLGSEAHPAYAVSFTPDSAARARSALSPRYRFTTVPGLGEALDPRGDPGLSGSRRLPCALVPVPGPLAARVVCGSDAATLASAGRWLALTADTTDTAGADSADLAATATGDALRRSVLPAARRALQSARQDLASGAAAARRAHDRPPDLGDPEALAAMLGDLVAELDAAGGDLVRAAMRVELAPAGVTAQASMTLRPEGESSLARDARARVGASGEHPLAALLPPDAAAAFATRGAPEARAAALSAAVTAVLRVLGDRVTDPAAARADLEALVAHPGDAAAVAAAPDAPDGVELTAVVSQSDGGAAARAVLGRMARAPWLRSLRLGGSVTLGRAPGGAPGGAGVGGVLVLTLPPRAATATVQPGPPRSLAVAVRAGALVLVAGRHAAASLEAVAARAGGVAPAVLGTDAASAVAGVDLAAAGSSGRIGLTYTAQREGDAVTATARATLPTAALGLAARLWADDGGRQGPTAIRRGAYGHP